MRALLLSSLLLAAFLCRPAFGGDIHAAVQKGDLEAIRTLLTANPALINAQTVMVGEWWLNGTPLHWASCAGQKDVVELLLAHNASDEDIRSLHIGEPVTLTGVMMTGRLSPSTNG